MDSRPEKTGQFEFLQSGLASHFRDFCQFLDARIRTMAATERMSGEGDAPPSLGIPNFDGLIVLVVVEIKRIGQAVNNQQPELSDVALHEFQFLLAAWADESLIKIVQDRLPITQRGNVERSMFGTVHAGDEFFRAVERMVSRRNADDIAMAGAYWLALMVGFEGRYIGSGGGRELRRYADSLRSMALRVAAPPDNPENLAYRSGSLAKDSPRTTASWPPRPRTAIALTLTLLVTVVLSLEMHWEKNTEKLAQVLKAMSDLHQSSAEHRDIK
ncbi:DotU family type IV/VI secretion system protein [Polaromonas sp.]|jgi:type IV/VI secretion system ImpK/VasF family protein|uniref:DotU family type IV/VI secretion system protein n=1 Tax=Polaromonas sp. TaxID=1869339 RepID=UPI0037C6C855